MREIAIIVPKATKSRWDKKRYHGIVSAMARAKVANGNRLSIANALNGGLTKPSVICEIDIFLGFQKADEPQKENLKTA